MGDLNHPQRLMPNDPRTRDIAMALYAEVKELPIVSPHGHTDPAWFACNEPFKNPAELLIKPDHYVFRMLYSQGISLEKLGLGQDPVEPEVVWQIFADNYHLFRGTPSRMWLDHVFGELFGLTEMLTPTNAQTHYQSINKQLNTPEFFPRALFDKFAIETLATTESPLDSLRHHKAIEESDWQGNVITTFRPDPVVDPEYECFASNLKQLGTQTGTDTSTYTGYLTALRTAREEFKAHGATATDHGHPTARTAVLSESDAKKLFDRVIHKATAQDAEMFRAHMLTQMASMSLDDGLVMQIHPGSSRNHNQVLFERYGRDKGADIPMRTDFVNDLKPLLNLYGNEANLSVIAFTLDETTYSRELAPLAGHYPCLKLGPAWWFHDSPEGMRRFREQTTSTAGFYNTVGFNDDTRAFLSIPARHDMARRVDCGYLAHLVAEHQLGENEAVEVAVDLAYRLAKQAYKL